MFKQTALISGLLFFSALISAPTAQPIKASKDAVIAWDLHQVLFTKPHGHGHECHPKMETFSIVKMLYERRIRQTILSNISKKSFCKLFKKNPTLFSYFDLSNSLVDTSGIFDRKPHSKYYKNYLAKNNGTKPDNIIFIDDKLENIRGARKHHMQAIQFCSAKQVHQELVKRHIL